MLATVPGRRAALAPRRSSRPACRASRRAVQASATSSAFDDASTPRRRYTPSSKPTRIPPRATQDRQREQPPLVTPDGRDRPVRADREAAAASLPAPPGSRRSRPGTPRTRFARSGVGSSPRSSMRTAWTTCPTSNISASSPMPSSRRARHARASARARSRTAPRRSSSSPSRRPPGRDRPRVPSSARPSASTRRRRSRPWSRSASGSRSAPIVSSNSSRRLLGEPSSSRTCRWADRRPGLAHRPRRRLRSRPACAEARGCPPS